MSKFKAGDEVRCMMTSREDLTYGRIYEVVSVCNGWYRVVTDHGVIDGYREHVFELVESNPILTPEEVFEHIHKGAKLQVRDNSIKCCWYDVINPELITYQEMLTKEWRVKPEPEVIELNGKKYREIVE